MKLSWQELHFRLIPRKICAEFCAACRAGVWLALTAPRQNGEASFLPELFDPAPAFLRDLGEGLPT